MKTVYLAGPIAGCTRSEANDWRGYVRERLNDAGIQGISPLRCEPLIGDRYMLSHVDARFGTPKAIAGKNMFDVRNCDITFAYLPREIGLKRPSYGTVCEIAWAGILGKPVILVSNDEYVREHPVIQSNVDWLLDDLDDGIDVCLGVLLDYTRL